MTLVYDNAVLSVCHAQVHMLWSTVAQNYLYVPSLLQIVQLFQQLLSKLIHNQLCIATQLSLGCTAAQQQLSLGCTAAQQQYTG